MEPISSVIFCSVCVYVWVCVWGGVGVGSYQWNIITAAAQVSVAPDLQWHTIWVCVCKTEKKRMGTLPFYMKHNKQQQLQHQNVGTTVPAQVAAEG